MELPYLGKKTEKTPFDLAAKGDLQVKLVDYGPILQKNKVDLWRACNQLNLAAEEKRIIMAIANLESTHMDIEQRDKSKDATPSKNVSVLNMNIDMLHQLGLPTTDKGDALNKAENVKVAVAWAVRAMRTWTCKRFLDFHRGGRTGFNDGVSYDTYGYRNGIVSLMRYLRADLTLCARDSRRAEIFVKAV